MKFKIRSYRRAKDITQEALAKKSGVHRITIVALEKRRGTENKNARIGTLEKIAKALDVKVSDLLDE